MVFSPVLCYDVIATNPTIGQNFTGMPFSSIRILYRNIYNIECSHNLMIERNSPAPISQSNDKHIKPTQEVVICERYFLA